MWGPVLHGRKVGKINDGYLSAYSWMIACVPSVEQSSSTIISKGKSAFWLRKDSRAVFMNLA
jgi:hypothetical protein